MGKTAGAKKGKQLPAASIKARGEVRNNPFEVKINKQKFNVLGRKTKHDVGLPGVSKSKALKKRKETILQEYKQRGKSSLFTDKRFGEYDTKLTPEEKMLKRFALERQRTSEKKNLYNLNEDEELTHYGQSLAELEKLNDIVDSDSDSEERGALSAELTSAHFGGGGLLKKKTASDQKYEDMEKPKSRKELIEEMIAKSKEEKRERQTQKEKTLELTEKLDSDWKTIQGLLSHKVPKSERKKEDEKPKPDEYDKIVRELGFEMKAMPCDRMKSEEELAKEEKERLEKLEADRLRRMRGEDKDTKRPKHISADDLMDDFIINKDDRLMLSYKDGVANLPLAEEADKEDGDSEAEEAGDSAEEEDDDEEDESDEGADESDSPDNHSDLESDAGSDQDDDTEDKVTKKKTKSKEEKMADAKAAKAELPFTFGVPDSYERFQSLLSGKPAEQQLVVLERIQKCNHPSLAEGNKDKLQKLFGFLIEYIADLACSDPPDLKTIDKLVVPLYNLCQMFPEAAAESVRSVLNDTACSLDQLIEAKGRTTFPGLPVLIYLKVTAILFPTSDFRHPVVTPAMIIMSQLLTKCSVSSLEDVAAGLCVCCLFLEYVSLSQRFIPELINFLLGLLHMAAPNKEPTGYTLVPPFKAHGRNAKLLLVENKEDIGTWVKKSLPLAAINGLQQCSESEKNHFKLTCVAVCLDLVRRCVDIYRSLPPFQEIMSPIKVLLCDHLPHSEYPAQLQELRIDILKEIECHGKKPYKPLVFEKQMPVPMKMFTPKVRPVLDFGRKQSSNKVDHERKKLIHKHKKEFKGAVREIRRDNQFLARVQLSETMERDAERKKKVKELFNSLSTQEGEWKALKKRKRKGK